MPKTLKLFWESNQWEYTSKLIWKIQIKVHKLETSFHLIMDSNNNLYTVTQNIISQTSFYYTLF